MRLARTTFAAPDFQVEGRHKRCLKVLQCIVSHVRNYNLEIFLCIGELYGRKYRLHRRIAGIEAVGFQAII
jgi:hypothetical protein